MLAAGVVILTHELSHGIQCVIEGVRVKSAAIMVAVITFGGAVEPDEEEMNKAPPHEQDEDIRLGQHRQPDHGARSSSQS